MDQELPKRRARFLGYRSNSIWAKRKTNLVVVCEPRGFANVFAFPWNVSCYDAERYEMEFCSVVDICLLQCELFVSCRKPGFTGGSKGGSNASFV